MSHDNGFELKNRMLFKIMLNVISFNILSFLTPNSFSLNVEEFTNKRPIGHIAHLWNQFKSINTFLQSYDYIIQLIFLRRKIIISFLNNYTDFESLSPKDALCQVWFKLTHWFCRRRFLDFVNIFLVLTYNYIIII